MYYQLTPLIRSDRAVARIQPSIITIPIALLEDVWKDQTVLELCNFWMPKCIDGYQDVPTKTIRPAFSSWKRRGYTRKRRWLSLYDATVVNGFFEWLRDLCSLLTQYPNADFSMTFRRLK